MAKVCVVGAGRAGVEAATEAAGRGADVTLLEKTEEGIPPKMCWPDFIRSPQSAVASRYQASIAGGVQVWYSNPVLSVRPGIVTTSEGGLPFEKVVVTTGSVPVIDAFPGFRKPGVVLLDSFSGFRELCVRMCSTSDAVVTGEGPTGLRVADSLNRGGRRVTLASPGGTMLPKELALDLDAIVLAAASRAGIRVVSAPLDRAYGSQVVEAVVAGGEVIPCDTLAVVPREAPSLPGGGAGAGLRGGIRVDQKLRSEEKCIYAAGGCAEFVGPGFASGVSLKDSAESSGRIAGANAAGEEFAFDPVGGCCLAVFGLCVSWAGLTLGEARLQGYDAAQTTTRIGKASGCSLVFNHGNGRLIGIQTVEESGKDLSALLALLISQRVGLRALAHGDFSGSTDISPLSEAARRALTEEALASG